MVKFKVNLAELDKVASQLTKQVQVYETILKSLMSVSGNINSAWQSEESAEYMNRLKKQLEDSVRVIDFIEKYAQFLKKSSKAYKNAQRDVIDYAKSL